MTEPPAATTASWVCTLIVIPSQMFRDYYLHNHEQQPLTTCGRVTCLYLKHEKFQQILWYHRGTIAAVKQKRSCTCSPECQVHHFTYVAVQGRNWTLFRCIFRVHYRFQSAVMQYFSYRRGSYVLCKLMNTWHIYIAHIGPTPNRSSALQHFKRGNALEIRNRITFDFYPGLPRMSYNTL